MDADALVVGGGPVGLATAIGLSQRGLKVLVLERAASPSKDWSSTYTYRIDSRGIACLDRLGLASRLAAEGVESRGFSGVNWELDGSLTERSSNASIGLGYWIQRPALIALLESALPEGALLRGSLRDLRLSSPGAGSPIEADVELIDTGPVKIRVQVAFGCDGSHSKVRQCIQAIQPALASVFEPRVLRTPSSGLVYKAVLYDPPEMLDPGKTHVVKGRTGRSLGMLPFVGKPGQSRPVSFAQPPDHAFHGCRAPDEVYALLREEFPQLEVDTRLSTESAAAWCTSAGSTFPSARWCPRASYVVGEAGFALLGDALHSFPPDLGQGVNAGLCDVAALLKLWPLERSQWAACLRAYEESQVPEAEAICRLLPIGFPYQYNLPRSFAKLTFFADMLTRVLANKLFPSFFFPAVVFMVTTDPPLRYTEILQRHKQNTKRLLGLALTVLGASVLTGTVLRRTRYLSSS